MLKRNIITLFIIMNITSFTAYSNTDTDLAVLDEIAQNNKRIALAESQLKLAQIKKQIADLEQNSTPSAIIAPMQITNPHNNLTSNLSDVPVVLAIQGRAGMETATLLVSQGNTQIVSVGDIANGWAITDIKQGRVMAKKNNETRVLSHSRDGVMYSPQSNLTPQRIHNAHP